MRSSRADLACRAASASDTGDAVPGISPGYGKLFGDSRDGAA